MPRRLAMTRPFALAIAGLVLAAAPVAAQMPPGMAANPMMPGGAPTVVLTDQKVEGFIASYPQLEARMDELEAKYSLPRANRGSPAAAWQAFAANRQLSGELDAFVAEYGFASYGEWVLTATAIATAHAFAREGGDMDAQMQETIDRVRNDPNIPEAQRQMILQQIQAQAQMMGAMRPSEENLAVVGRYGDQIDTLFDTN